MNGAIAEARAHALFELLDKQVYGVFQQSDGGYNRRRDAIDVDALTAHFQGESTIAVQPVVRGVGRMICFDIDDHFAQRLPIISSELQKREYDKGAICTSGSSENRGKVLVFFSHSLRQCTLQSIAEAILAAAIASPSWGKSKPGEISIFPHAGEGGLIRIGGRNRKPARTAQGVDEFFSLNGQPRELVDVRPVSVFPAISAAGLGRFVDREIASEWRLDGKTYPRVLRLCYEANRLFGVAGDKQITKWRDKIWSHSPELQRPTNQDASRVRRGWQRCWTAAWRRATAENLHAARMVERYTLSRPETRSLEQRPDNVSLTATQRRIIAALWGYCIEKGVTPDAVAISYRQISAHAGVSVRTAYRQVGRLADLGLVVVHDKGTPRVGGGGKKVILGLVADGSSPSSARSIGRRRGNVKQRSEWRQRHPEWGGQNENASESRQNGPTRLDSEKLIPEPQAI